MRHLHAPGRVLFSLGLVMAGSWLTSGARADCDDRDIVLGSGSGTIICSGETCSEVNTYDPGPLGCVRALGGAIRRILDDSELAQCLGKAGRERVLTTFDERFVFARLEKFYRELAVSFA